MAELSKIEWTDRTWNPLSGCTRVSEGCRNCYAEKFAHRWRNMPDSHKYSGLTDDNGRWNGRIKLHEKVLRDPFKWRDPQKIFVNSQSDLFHESVPFDFIDKVFAVMALTTKHTYQVLTKRPERMAEYMSLSNEWPLQNVWLGTSVENQKAADERIPHLLRCPAAVRFLSCEPLLGPVDLLEAFIVGPEGGHEWFGARREMISWVILGGESGPGARPCDVAWIRSIVEQCRDAGVAPFVKQLGSHVVIDLRYDRTIPGATRRLAHPKGGDWDEWPEDLRVREMPESPHA